jgi:PPP family 3-phenylpropionic acid transporter
MSLTSRLFPVLAALRRGPLPSFLVLFAALYGAYGTQSPFFPAFLGSRGLSAEAIGTVLAYSTAVKLVAAPLAGRLADRIGNGRLVLAGFAAATGLFGFAYLAVAGVWAAALVATAWSIAIAPLAPLADALALAASGEGRMFPYGWVRGAGSAAFVAGTLASGFAVARSGLPVIMVVSGVLFVLMALIAMRVPSAPVEPAATAAGRMAGIGELLRNRPFRMLMLVAALIMGSHAMSDSFAVIRWRAAGLAPPTISLLWSLSVIAEVAVFLLIGPMLLKRIGPAGGAAIAAVAGILRWSVMASTTAVPAMMAVQTLHGFTFALLHLCAMQLIGRVVPPHLAATGQTLYGAVAIGIANVLVTLASGPLYAHLGGGGFWAMAALCGVALPLTRGLAATPRDNSQETRNQTERSH